MCNNMNNKPFSECVMSIKHVKTKLVSNINVGIVIV